MELAGVGDKRSQSTDLWRRGLSCQLTATEGAVVEMLSFLGFAHAEFLPPTEKAWSVVTTGAKRGTFLAVR